MSSFPNDGTVEGNTGNPRSEKQNGAAMSKLLAARRDFDLPKDELNQLTRIYLNAASRTPLMKETVEVGQVAMARQMQTPWSIASEEDELKIREAFATLIHCHDPEQIAYTPSCSYAISLAAKNIFEDLFEKNSIPTGSLKIFYDFTSYEDSHVKSVAPAASGTYSGQIVGDFTEFSTTVNGEGYFNRDNYLKIKNTDELFSRKFSFIFANSKTSIEKR